MPLITEGQATIEVSAGKITKKLPVFYNPHMKLNRDINIALLNAIKKPVDAIDLLAGSGVRGIRILKETKVKSVHFEDINTKKTVQQNCKRNSVTATITNEGANTTLLKSKGFDYIDIDPFGSPNPYLDAATKRIRKDGILAVTATDTSALCGAYTNSCRRKYWATPLHTAEMHEVGIRILIRKVQLVAGQYEKALTPIFSHATRHYMRVYLKVDKGRKKVNEIIKQHKIYNDAGPLWTGQLWDTKLIRKMKSEDDKAQALINTIKDEATIQTVGFLDIHAIAKKEKLSQLPKTEDIVKEIQKTNEAALTHFSQYGLRTDIEYTKFVKILQKLVNHQN